jgi:hypothetical protein
MATLEATTRKALGMGAPSRIAVAPVNRAVIDVAPL